jgi:hypothetical protein
LFAIPKHFGCTAEQNAVNFELFFVSKLQKLSRRGRAKYSAFVCNSEKSRCAAEQNRLLLVAIPTFLCTAERNAVNLLFVLVGKFQNFRCAAEQNTVLLFTIQNLAEQNAVLLVAIPKLFCSQFQTFSLRS